MILKSRHGQYMIGFISVIILVVLVTCLFLKIESDKVSFDRSVWVSFQGSNRWDNPRYDMVRDLIDEHLYIGMPKLDVIALLATPELINNSRSVEYLLGAPRGLIMPAFDPYSLRLEFDDQYLISDMDIEQK